MKCGEYGYMTVAGNPCGQTLSQNEKACLWHSRTPEQRTHLALRGALASQMNMAIRPEKLSFTFTDEDSVIAFAEDMARRALTENVDRKRITTALDSAKVALAGFAAKTTARMVAALESIEHGGAAMVLLTQMSERLGTGTRRALPGRVVKAVDALSANGGVDGKAQAAS